MFLGIDQGTTGTTALLLSKKGKVLGSFTVAVPQHFPKPGWVEHDPHEIWKTVGQAVTGVLKKTRTKASSLAAIGLTNQRETVSLFDGSKALHRFIVWQDRRTATICDSLKVHEAFIQERSGLPLDPYFSASKILWMKRDLKISSARSLRFRTIESFLIERMSGADMTEVTNASRTSLLNLKSLQWDQDLLSLYDIPSSWCPRLVASEGYEIKTKDLGFLPQGIPIVSALGDQQAALFGQCAWKKGEGKITFGTGSFILVHVGEQPETPRPGIVSTLALCRANGERSYALEGSVFNCGAWISWLKEGLGLIEKSADSERLASKVKNSSGVLVLPALTGLGAPFWNPQARGTIAGLTRGVGRAEIARASLEALAFQNRALIDAMGFGSHTKTKSDKSEFSTTHKSSWRVDGGAVRNNLLMQIQADILNAPLVRPKNLEATALGAASLAALSIGAFSWRDLKTFWQQDRFFKPSPKNHRELAAIYDRWMNLATRA